MVQYLFSHYSLRHVCFFSLTQENQRMQGILAGIRILSICPLSPTHESWNNRNQNVPVFHTWEFEPNFRAGRQSHLYFHRNLQQLVCIRVSKHPRFHSPPALSLLQCPVHSFFDVEKECEHAFVSKRARMTRHVRSHWRFSTFWINIEILDVKLILCM